MSPWGSLESGKKVTFSIRFFANCPRLCPVGGGYDEYVEYVPPTLLIRTVGHLPPNIWNFEAETRCCSAGAICFSLLHILRAIWVKDFHTLLRRRPDLVAFVFRLVWRLLQSLQIAHVKYACVSSAVFALKCLQFNYISIDFRVWPRTEAETLGLVMHGACFLGDLRAWTAIFRKWRLVCLRELTLGKSRCCLCFMGKAKNQD